MYLQTPIPAWSYPPPGNVVSVETHLLWRHKGVVSDRLHNGKPMVISASARAGVACEEPWELFSGGSEVQDEGYPGTLPKWQVLQRARMMIGRGYLLLKFNCDHFIAIAHGQEPRSPQLGATIAVAFVAMIVGAAMS